MYNYISPEANNYPGADRGFNQRWRLDDNLKDNTKGYGVYICQNESDIQSALERIATLNAGAIASGEVRVVSGGHCYENFTYQSSKESLISHENFTKYVIDLSEMRGIYKEEVNSKEYLVIEPGASNWTMSSALHSRYGAALPGGSCYSVCAGGHIAGGGYGLLSRLHGLTVDYLCGVEMVIPDVENGGFKKRSFNGKDSADSWLDWASKGGGAGHFGLITKYYFDLEILPKSPERALFIVLPLPRNKIQSRDDFYNLLQDYYNACAALPEQAFALGKFVVAPEGSDPMKIVLQVVYGDSSGHDATKLGGKNVAAIDKIGAMIAIQTFQETLGKWTDKPTKSLNAGQMVHLKGHPIAGSFLEDTYYDLPWIDLTQMLNGSGDNRRGKYKSSYMKANFNEMEAVAIYDFLFPTEQDIESLPSGIDLSETLIQIDSYGAQINEMDDGSGAKTAVAARASILKTQYQTYWKRSTDEGDIEVDNNIVKWFNQKYNNIHFKAIQQPFPVWGDKYQGCYFNYPDRQLGVNEGHKTDEDYSYNDFMEIYFGSYVASKLKEIKMLIDPDDIFSFAQSVPVTSKSGGG